MATEQVDPISNEDIIKYQSVNNIRPDAVAVRTESGTVVFVDPDKTEIIKNYQTGVISGDQTELTPDGVIAKMHPPVEVLLVSGTIPSPEPTASILPILPYVPSTPQLQYSSSSLSLQININVLPAFAQYPPDPITIPWSIDIVPIPLPLHDGLMAAVRRLINGKIESYFDQDRINKTLLNFGLDYQALLFNWQYDVNDLTGASILVKLAQPLPAEIEPFTQLWISRELSPSYLDQIFVVFVPGEGLKVYLRPPNRSIDVQSLNGLEVNNVTQQTLFTTGSTSVTNLSDPVLEEWFTTALEGVELNIQYNDYSQFVFYSSAVKRLEAFRQKLLLLEDYNNIITEQSASMAAATAGTGITGFTGSLAYGGYQRISEQRLDLIRSFDGYERFLYYDSGSAYSSSFSGDRGAVDQLYYLNDVTWPKISGSLISVASASNSSLYSVGGSNFSPTGDYSGVVSWWDAINFIADEYDLQNVNRLANNLPDYLTEDEQSADFLTFVDMIGHHFDILKSYADAMPQIYNRDNDPQTGLSADMVWNIAASFGIDLPNQYAVKQLVDYTIGELGQVSPTVYRQTAAETWKRFLHNQIYLLKSKGTKSSLRGLLNTYGVLPTAIQIRESATPSFYVTQSYELIEEQTNTLNITSGSYLKIPFSGSGIPAIQTVQVRFATTVATQSVLFNVNNAWGVRLLPLSSSYGRVALVNSAGTTIASSSVFDLYSGLYYTITVERSGVNASLWTQRIDDSGEIVNSSTVTGSLGTWFSGSILALGSSGSSWGTRFVGDIDEFRLWSEALWPSTINFHVQYPALYNGNTTTSARDNLPVRLSFNKPQNLNTNPLLLNESPYARTGSVPAALTAFSASGFINNTSYPYNMNVVTRNVLRYSPNAGASQFVSNKITIADSPVLRYLNVDSGSAVPVLSHEKSIVTVDEKFDKVQSNNIVGFYFSPIDAINDSIIKTIGNIDIQNYIGTPSDLFESDYSDLAALNRLYWTSYAYTYDYNDFINFIDTLFQPLFTQARQLVPARTKLITGIVLESPILERNKIKWNPVDLSGKGTSNEEDTPTFYPEAITSEPEEIQTEYPVKDALIDLNETSPIESDFLVKETTLITSDETEVSAENSTYTATVDLSNEVSSIEDIESSIVFYDDETNRFNYYKYLLRRFNVISPSQLSGDNLTAFNQSLLTFSPGTRIIVTTGMNSDMPDNLFINTIEPYVDFSNIGYINYFMQMAGIVLIPSTITVRIGQSTLTSAGTWTKGSTYVRNQYVIQSGSSGTAEDGNGFEYVCVTPLASGSFISYNPPSIDVNNWSRVRYTTQGVYITRVATQISGSIELASPTGGYTPFTGYYSKHYRFRRNTGTGFIRRNWYGCKQTDSTTFDGGPAVEVILSAGDVLVVAQGADPIQRSTDAAGPRLDVK